MKPYQIIVGVIVLALILLLHREILRNQDTEPRNNTVVQQQQDIVRTVSTVPAQTANLSADLPGLKKHIQIINEMNKDTFESTEEFEQRREKEIAKMAQAAAEGNAAYQAGILTMRKYDADREILTADFVWKEEVLALLPDLKVAESALIKIPRKAAKDNFSEQKSHPFCINLKWSHNAIRFAKIIIAGKNGETWPGVVEPKMVAIPGGIFYRKSLDNKKIHQVTLKPFYFGKYEITFTDWDACVFAESCTHPLENIERGRRAVSNASKDDVQEYIRWLNEVTGKKYRLPTEAEWDYAARAGKKEYKVVHVTEENISTVGLKNANAWGLHDMYGNADELVVDKGAFLRNPMNEKDSLNWTRKRTIRIGFRLALSQNE